MYVTLLNQSMLAGETNFPHKGQETTLYDYEEGSRRIETRAIYSSLGELLDDLNDILPQNLKGDETGIKLNCDYICLSYDYIPC